MRRKRGFIYVLSLGIVFFLTVAGTTMLMRGVSDTGLSEHVASQQRAFHLADAGIDDALSLLRDPLVNNWDLWSGTGQPISMGGMGTYETLVDKDGGTRKIRSTGNASNPIPNSRRIIEAWVQRVLPPNFYDNAIYGAGSIELIGNAYSVNGRVLSSSPIGNTQNVQCINPPCVIQDPQASPLPKLSFAQLRQLADGQWNVYDAARLERIRNKQEFFPRTFCFSPPTDPNDPSTCTPNINYIEGDLVLSHDIGTVGGLFVVVGNVLTDLTAAPENTTIEGNGEVVGAIYTTGDFIVRGGGNGLNVDGGVWAGDLARLNGSVVVQYNATYMNSIKKLDIYPELQLLLWRECPPTTGCLN